MKSPEPVPTGLILSVKAVVNGFLAVIRQNSWKRFGPQLAQYRPVRKVASQNQALSRVLRYSFLTAPMHLGKFARTSSRVPVVAPAGSAPWGWQLLRFTNTFFSEALYRHPGVRSKVAGPKGTGSGAGPKVTRSLDKREKGTIVRDIAITASAFGIATGAPFAVIRSGKDQDRRLNSEHTELIYAMANSSTR